MADTQPDFDSRVLQACRTHGALRVSDAAYAAMSGQGAALRCLGLGDLCGNLAALNRATTLAYGLMPDEDRAADLAAAEAALAKLPAGAGDRNA